MHVLLLISAVLMLAGVWYSPLNPKYWNDDAPISIKLAGIMTGVGFVLMTLILIIMK